MSVPVAEHSWQTGAPRFWEAYFAVCLVAVGAFIFLVAQAATVERRLLVLGLLVAMAAWYLAFGRRIVAEAKATWRGPVFLVVLLVLFAAAMLLVDASSFLLFIFCPLVYMAVRLHWGHVAVAAFAFTPAVATFITDGPRALAVTLPIGVIATAMSMVIAVTTHRVERISDERAGLITELESTRAELARVSRAAGIAEERQRLAGEIHDTVAQGLSSVVMLVEAADGILDRDPDAARAHLSLAARTARENLDETRAIVAALTPTSLTDATLADALGRLADRFRREVGTPTAMTVVGPPRPLATGTEVVLLRVVQEALNNIRKHAGAATIAIELNYRPATVAVEVRDDGCGFDVAALAPGYGLGGMQARVEQVGGRLSIASTPGAGTTVRSEV